MTVLVLIMGAGIYLSTIRPLTSGDTNQEVGAAPTSSTAGFTRGLSSLLSSVQSWFPSPKNASPTNLVSGNLGILKSPLRGLLSMGDISFRDANGIPDNSLTDIYAEPAIFGGVVVNVTWAQLEPTQGTLVTTPIDQALANVRTYNAKYPNTPLGVRLRVAQGNDAPDWAKNLGGAPISVLHHQDVNRSITLGRYWTPAYESAWTQLQTMLAKKYDSEPLIHDVANSSCSSETDEPFIIPEDQLSLQALRTAGLTDAAYQACLLNSITQYQGWKTTGVEFPFNPFRESDSGKIVQNSAITIQIMNQFRSQLGARAVLSNHSMNPPTSSHTEAPLLLVYSEIKKLGKPINLQQEGPHDDWMADVAYGISSGASSIEIWDTQTAPKFTSISTAELQQWSRSILMNSK